MKRNGEPVTIGRYTIVPVIESSFHVTEIGSTGFYTGNAGVVKVVISDGRKTRAFTIDGNETEVPPEFLIPTVPEE